MIASATTITFAGEIPISGIPTRKPKKLRTQMEATLTSM